MSEMILTFYLHDIGVFYTQYLILVQDARVFFKKIIVFKLTSFTKELYQIQHMFFKVDARLL